MIASSTILGSDYDQVKMETDEERLVDCSPPPARAGSVSPKSADENASHYTATSSPSSTIVNTNNRSSVGTSSGNASSSNTGANPGSNSASSSGQMTTESPQSSAETSQRTSFDFNSLLNSNSNSINNNNNDKAAHFDLGLPFGASESTPQQKQNPFGGGPFGALPFGSNLGSASAILQLSQMFGGGASAPPASLQANAKQQLNATLLHQHLQQASELQHQQQKADTPAFGNRGGSGGRAPNNSQNDQERKRTYPYTFQYCVLCSKNVHSSKLPCHIRQCHIAKPMFKCPECDFTSTYSKNNVKSHMVSLHGLAGEPISYMEQFAAQVEAFMKECFPNVRGRGRPVHGRGSPRSPASPHVAAQQNGQQRAANQTKQRQAGGRMRQALANNRGAPTLQVPQMPAANRLGEMFAMLNQQKPPTNEKIEAPPLHPLNPFAYFQNLGYLNQQFVQKFKEPKAEPPTAPNTQQMSMEQLLKDFSARIVSAPYAQHENKATVEEPMSNLPNAQESKQPNEEEEADSTIEPLYLPRDLKLKALGHTQIPSTVFATFGNNSTELLEQLDLSHEFETLINDQPGLLTREQAERVADVRKRLNLQAFEVLFAVHRLDLDVLPLPKLGLVASIAPTTVDVRRFELFERSNNTRNLSDDEQFVLQLAQVERLREKLAVMRAMGTFDQAVQKISQQLHDISAAAKLLHNSSEFHSILQLLLISANVINGDLNSELIGGFRTSSIVDVCSYKFPNGLSLLELLATRIHLKFPALKSFAAHHTTIEAAANANFSDTLTEIRQLERAKMRVEAELNASSSNECLVEFLKRANAELAQLTETAQIAKSQVHTTLEFFGEPIGDEKVLKPEAFFRKIADFSRNFQAVLCSI